MAYDDGDITTRERLAANHQKDIAPYNRNTLNEIHSYNNSTVNQLANYNQKVAGKIANFNQGNANSLATYNKDNASTLNTYNKATATNVANYSNDTADRLSGYNQNSANTLATHNAGMQRKIADNNIANTNTVANHNANAVKDQVQQQIDNYDFANTQNASLRDVQLKQSSRKAETERFEAQRQLQNAAIGVLGSLNQAMNGSTIGNLMHMLRNRNDSENTNYWQQLMDNWNSVLNSYDESYNQNQVAKKDAVINARKAIRDIQGDLSANLNNIQGDLSANLGTINSDLLANLSAIGADTYSSKRNAESDRYASARGANADYVNNWGSIEGDRFNNYNNAAAEEYTSKYNERAERFKDRNQVEGDRFTSRRNLEGDLSANLNNINPNLYEAPNAYENHTTNWGDGIPSDTLPTPQDVNNSSGDQGTNPGGINTTTLANTPTPATESLNNITLSNFSIPQPLQTIAEIENNSVFKDPSQHTALNNVYDFISNIGTGINQHLSTLADYVMPANAEQNVRSHRNTLRGNDYFSQLINMFNNRLV